MDFSEFDFHNSTTFVKRSVRSRNTDPSRKNANEYRPLTQALRDRACRRDASERGGKQVDAQFMGDPKQPHAISPNTDPSRRVASGWEPHHKNTDLSRKILIVQKTSAAEA